MVKIQRNFNPESVENTITAAAALKKMNETIAFRLAVHELMPPGLRLIKIRKYHSLNAVGGF